LAAPPVTICLRIVSLTLARVWLVTAVLAVLGRVLLGMAHAADAVAGVKSTISEGGGVPVSAPSLAGPAGRDLGAAVHLDVFLTAASLHASSPQTRKASLSSRHRLQKRLLCNVAGSSLARDEPVSYDRC